MSNFDRYSSFRANGMIEFVPFVEIRKKSTDKYIKYDKKTMRFDRLSYKYYNSPDFAWLILQANPEMGSIENFITDGSILRIPFPLEETLNSYLNDIKTYKELQQK